MMRSSIYSTIIILLVFACSSCNDDKGSVKKLDTGWLDSIMSKADSSYSKPYHRTDFVTAHYFLNRKDSTLCQLMKDSAGRTRQVIVTAKNVRSFFGQYYANGQLQAQLPLDNFGQYHGDAVYYYADGQQQRYGKYDHGLQVSEWKYFDEGGKLVEKQEFNNNGELVKTTQYK